MANFTEQIRADRTLQHAEPAMIPHALYTDGGVIGRNPSTIGGTWAYRILTADGQVIEQASGAIIPAEADVDVITNNLTELYAALHGLEKLPANFTGAIYSDSQITLGRLFWSWRWTNIPPWMHNKYRALRKRITTWEQITPVLLAGHPTRAELAAGIGHSNLPVSMHNLWCDQACQQAGRAYLAARQAIAQAITA